jgi:uncharacterized peroxidase-related enzyme
MAFIELVSDEAATGTTSDIYAQARASMGYVPNFARAFGLRPEVYRAWQQLNGAIRSAGDLRRYELATFAAARRLRSSYCSLAHGKILAERFLDADALRAFPRTLSAVEQAVVEPAEKVAADATSVTRDDVDRLRRFGLSDAEILDVVLAAAVRAFFTKVLDAIGVQPDRAYGTLDAALRDALTVGRPIEAADI